MPSKRKDAEDTDAVAVINEALYDHAAEHMVCGYMMDTPGVLTGDMVSRLTADDFHFTETRATFVAIKSVLASDRLPVPLTVLQEMRPDIDPTCIPSIFDLEEWKNRAVWSPEAEGHAARILKFAEARRLEAALSAGVRLLHSVEAVNAPLGSLTFALQAKFNSVTTETTDIDEFNAETLELVDDTADMFLVDGVLQDAGLNLLAAEGGIGKSVAAMDLSLRVLAGGSAFGGQVNRQGGVLYCGADCDKVTMKKRFHRMRLAAGYEEDLPGFRYIRAPLDFGNPATFSFILSKARQVAAEHPEGKIALLVVDSLASYMTTLDENSAGDCAHVMTQLRLVAERTGCCVLVLHHVNKSAMMTGSDRGRGSTALPNAADVVLTMQRKGASIIVSHTKSRNSSPMLPLVYTIEDTEDGGLLARFVPASAADLGEVMQNLCLDELARLAKDSAGEPLGRQELFLALDALGHFSFKTKERSWALLKLIPGYVFGRNGRTTSVVYRMPERPKGA